MADTRGVNRLTGDLRKLFRLPEEEEIKLEIIAESLPADSVRFEGRKGLIIDGERLMIGLAEDSPYLGEYSSYASNVRHHLEWLHRMGFDIEVVYDDGNNLSPLRDLWVHDGTGRENARYFFTCQGESVSEDTCYPGNGLLSYQFKAVLNELQREWKDADHENSLKWFNSNGEPGIAIATYVRAHNEVAGREEFFAYGNDSNIFAMRNCPFIFFGDIFQFAGEPYARKIFRREEIATKIAEMSRREFSEALFVEACILSSNDFVNTVDGDMEDMYIPNGTPNGISIAQLWNDTDVRVEWNMPGLGRSSMLKKIVILLQNARDTQNERQDFEIVSSNRRVEKKIQYSRHFYESGFSEPPIGEEDDEQDHEDEIGALTREQKAAVRDRIDQHFFDKEFTPERLSVVPIIELGNLAIGLLDDAHGFATAALVRMVELLNPTLEQLENHDAEIRRLLLLLPANPRELIFRWNESSVALQYSLILSEIFDNFHVDAFDAKKLYEGKLFHALILESQPAPTPTAPAPAPAGVFFDLPLLDQHCFSGEHLDTAAQVARNTLSNIQRIVMHEESLSQLTVTNKMLYQFEFLAEYLVRANRTITSRGICIFTAGSSAGRLHDVLSTSPSYDVVYVGQARDINAERFQTPPNDGITRVFIINRQIRDRIHLDIDYVDCIIDLGVTFNLTTKKTEFTSQNAVSQCLGLSGRLNCNRYLLVPKDRLRISHQKNGKNRNSFSLTKISDLIRDAAIRDAIRERSSGLLIFVAKNGNQVTVRVRRDQRSEDKRALMNDLVAKFGDIRLRRPDGSCEYGILDFSGRFDETGIARRIRRVDMAEVIAVKQSVCENLREGWQYHLLFALRCTRTILDNEQLKIQAAGADLPAHFEQLRDRLAQDRALLDVPATPRTPQSQVNDDDDEGEDEDEDPENPEDPETPNDDDDYGEYEDAFEVITTRRYNRAWRLRAFLDR